MSQIKYINYEEARLEFYSEAVIPVSPALLEDEAEVGKKLIELMNDELAMRFV